MKSILKILTPLADQPIYTAISDPEMSMDAVIQETIRSLAEAGRTHESQQISQLYKSHEIFNKGTKLSKGTLFKDLKSETREINGEMVSIAEIDLIKQHVGGA